MDMQSNFSIPAGILKQHFITTGIFIGMKRRQMIKKQYFLWIDGGYRTKKTCTIIPYYRQMVHCSGNVYSKFIIQIWN